MVGVYSTVSGVRLWGVDKMLMNIKKRYLPVVIPIGLFMLLTYQVLNLLHWMLVRRRRA